jgi:hypothetical protein
MGFYAICTAYNMLIPHDDNEIYILVLLKPQFASFVFYVWDFIATHNHMSMYDEIAIII